MLAVESEEFSGEELTIRSGWSCREIGDFENEVGLA